MGMRGSWVLGYFREKKKNWCGSSIFFFFPTLNARHPLLDLVGGSNKF